MNRVNKITSVFTITLFMAMWVTPLLSATNCDMECCNVEEIPSCHEEAYDSCCEMITECNTTSIQLIPVAPINKVSISKDISVTYNISFTENFEIQKDYYTIQLAEKLLIFEFHPGFQTPLLV